MGTGSNCSYTNSTSGVYIHLLCSSPACCDTLTHTCSASACSSSSDSSSGVNLNTYLFWVILAAAAIFTVLTLVVSYAICRYRRPGCAEAGAARDRFLEENIVAATLSPWHSNNSNNSSNSSNNNHNHHNPLHHHHHHHTASSPSSTSQASTSTPPSISSPHAGQSPSSSPDPLLLVHGPLHKARPGKSMIPVKKPTAAAVNKAFILGAEAFSHKPISVQGQDQDQGQEFSRGAGKGRQQGRRMQGLNDISVSGAASPRMVQLGGFTPRINLKSKGRTDSKQTILSSDTDSLTTVGS